MWGALTNLPPPHWDSSYLFSPIPSDRDRGTPWENDADHAQPLPDPFCVHIRIASSPWLRKLFREIDHVVGFKLGDVQWDYKVDIPVGTWVANPPTHHPPITFMIIDILLSHPQYYPPQNSQYPIWPHLLQHLSLYVSKALLVSSNTTHPRRLPISFWYRSSLNNTRLPKWIMDHTLLRTSPHPVQLPNPNPQQIDLHSPSPRHHRFSIRPGCLPLQPLLHRAQRLTVPR